MEAAKPLLNEITHYLSQLNTAQQEAVLGVKRLLLRKSPGGLIKNILQKWKLEK